MVRYLTAVHLEAVALQSPGDLSRVDVRLVDEVGECGSLVGAHRVEDGGNAAADAAVMPARRL